MLRQKSLKVWMPTKSGLGHQTHHKEVAFPRRAALLLSTILFLGHHSQPSIQDIHRQVITPRGDSDAFGSTPFRTSFDGQTPRRDLDPFGSSGPLRMTMETPRKDYSLECILTG
ncbi:hypothetical protein ACFX2C_034890 [Malus domestica]